MSVINGRVEGATTASFSHEGSSNESSLKKTEALLATVEAQLLNMLKQMMRTEAGGGGEGRHGAHHLHHAHRNDHAEGGNEAHRKQDTTRSLDQYDAIPNPQAASNPALNTNHAAHFASTNDTAPTGVQGSGSAKTTQALGTGTAYAASVEQAQATVHPKFMPVLRGDEQQKDAQIRNQDDFARAVDQTAKEYGLNPSVFRAQLEVESCAFSQGYKQAMHHEGDLDRAAENNTSMGMGQISRKFLDGREWAHDGPGNARVGSQVVTFDQYKDSPTIQLRMAASNLAQRIADGGGLKQGLSYYVSGNSNPNNPSGASYIAKIDAALKNPAVLNPGR